MAALGWRDCAFLAFSRLVLMRPKKAEPAQQQRLVMALPSCRRSPHCISCCADPACILRPPSGPERADEEEEGRKERGRKEDWGFNHPARAERGREGGKRDDGWMDVSPSSRLSVVRGLFSQEARRGLLCIMASRPSSLPDQSRQA